MVQLSHRYMTTGKTIALNIGTFAGKVMSLLLNTLFRSVIAFLPRSNLQESNNDADEGKDVWMPWEKGRVG